MSGLTNNTKGKNCTIKDMNGEILYEGNAPTRKIFLKILLQRKVSFAGANLKGYDFSNLDISELDFSKSNLENANLKGVIANKTNFNGANLRGTNAAAINAVNANFADVKMGKSTSSGNKTIFDHAVLTYSKFDNAEILNAEFNSAAMSRATFVGSTISKTKFNKAILSNTDFVESNVTSNDFTDAKIQSTFDLKVINEYLPDRTLNAKIYGNTFKNTTLDDNYKEFKRDKKWGQISTHLMWGIPAVTIAALTTVGESLTGNLLNIGMVAAPFAAAGLAKMEEIATNKYSILHKRINLEVRDGIAEMIRRGHNIKELGLLLASKGSRELLSKYTKNAEETFLKKIGATLSGDLEVIICHKKNLSEALSKMCDAMVNRKIPDRKIVITRVEDNNDNGPKTFILNPNGTTEAFWSHPEYGNTHIVWDENGNYSSGIPHPRLKHSDGTRNETIKLFMNLALIDHNLGEFSFDPEVSTVRVGKNKSSVVTSRKSGEITNREDGEENPIIMTAEGDMIYRSGVKEYKEDTNVVNFEMMKRKIEQSKESSDNYYDEEEDYDPSFRL